MEASELRIGNLLVKDGIVVTIDGRSIFDMWSLDHEDKYQPIPLNEEWLLRLGFSDKEYKKGYTGITFKGGGMYLDFPLHKPLEKGPWNENFTFDLPNHRYVDIPYIHQLQNLYFALTGKELEIKELVSKEDIQKLKDIFIPKDLQ